MDFWGEGVAVEEDGDGGAEGDGFDILIFIFGF